VGAKGQKSIQLGFKVTEELARKMEEERKIDHTTRAAFINDAIKHYIDYRENKRLELWKMKKEMIEMSIDQTHTKAKEEEKT